MEKLLTEFINTLEVSFKKRQQAVGEGAGFARLTISQLQYLEAIATLGTPTVTDIAHRLDITKASVTVGVNKLVKLGYVTKTQSSEDKLVFHIQLTEAGQQLVRVKAQALKTYEAFIFAALSDDETQNFEAILTKLVNRFRQI